MGKIASGISHFVGDVTGYNAQQRADKSAKAASNRLTEASDLNQSASPLIAQQLKSNQAAQKTAGQRSSQLYGQTQQANQAVLGANKDVQDANQKTNASLGDNATDTMRLATNAASQQALNAANLSGGQAAAGARAAGLNAGQAAQLAAQGVNGAYQNQLNTGISQYGQNAQAFQNQGQNLSSQAQNLSGQAQNLSGQQQAQAGQQAAFSGLANQNVGQKLDQAGTQASIATGNTGLANQQQGTANQQGGTALSAGTQIAGAILSDKNIKTDIHSLFSDEDLKFDIRDLSPKAQKVLQDIQYSGTMQGSGSITSDGNQKTGLQDLSGAGNTNNSGAYEVPKFNAGGIASQIKNLLSSGSGTADASTTAQTGASTASEAASSPEMASALAALSDRNAKADVQPQSMKEVLDSLLANVKPVSYAYKPGVETEKPEGTPRVGIIAQDLERTPLRDTVIDTPQGKKLDVGQLSANNTAMNIELYRQLVQLADRVHELEATRG